MAQRDIMLTNAL